MEQENNGRLSVSLTADAVEELQKINDYHDKLTRMEEELGYPHFQGLCQCLRAAEAHVLRQAGVMDAILAADVQTLRQTPPVETKKPDAWTRSDEELEQIEAAEGLRRRRLYANQRKYAETFKRVVEELGFPAVVNPSLCTYDVVVSHSDRGQDGDTLFRWPFTDKGVEPPPVRMLPPVVARTSYNSWVMAPEDREVLELVLRSHCLAVRKQER